MPFGAPYPPPGLAMPTTAVVSVVPEHSVLPTPPGLVPHPFMHAVLGETATMEQRLYDKSYATYLHHATRRTAYQLALAYLLLSFSLTCSYFRDMNPEVEAYLSALGSDDLVVVLDEASMSSYEREDEPWEALFVR